MLMLIAQEKRSINQLAENFEMSRPAVSKHLKILNLAGLVEIENQGRERYCTLNPSGFALVRNWFNYFDQFWTEKLQNLDQLMKKHNAPKQDQ